MAQTMAMTMRINTDLKCRGDMILERMGLTPSNFVSMAYSRLVQKRELPFDTKVEIDDQVLPDEGRLSRAALEAAIKKGFDDMEAGDVRPMEQVHADLRAKYGF